MFNKETGEIWTDEFCSLGHNAWKDYHSDSIFNLSNMMSERGIDINMNSVKQFVCDAFGGSDN